MSHEMIYKYTNVVIKINFLIQPISTFKSGLFHDKRQV